MVRGSGSPIPLIWIHKADDPRSYVGDVVEATETDDGLAIKGRFDLDTEFGKSAYRTPRAAECHVCAIPAVLTSTTATSAQHVFTRLFHTLLRVAAVLGGCGPETPTTRSLDLLR